MQALLEMDTRDATPVAAIEGLRYTRIARVGGHDRRRFSFVHRRFAEFFVVDAFRIKGQVPPIDGIPTDSRWRDCLVMYCGVAEPGVRRDIGRYCWEVIAARREALRNGQVLEARDAIHCIRFLADAFRGDIGAIVPFRRPLGQVVTGLVGSDDLLTAKIGAELIPLLDDEDQQEAITLALNTQSRWVSDTTLGSCRHLATLGPRANAAIRAYLQSLSSGELVRRFLDLSFSLSLSDAFRRQRRWLCLDLAEVLLLFLGAMIMAMMLSISAFRFFVACVLISAFMGLLETISVRASAVHTGLICLDSSLESPMGPSLSTPAW